MKLATLRNGTRDGRLVVVSRDLTRCQPVPAIARIAAQVNASVENIGARRLQTIMERLVEDISFDAPDKSGQAIRIDAAYVNSHLGELAQNEDLSRYIL